MNISTKRSGTCLPMLPAIVLIILSCQSGSAAPLPTLDLKVAFPELTFNRPLWMEEARDGSKRFFVVEQAGKVFMAPPSRKADETKVFLDITERKPFVQNEEGLLAFAFHPQFKTNGLFYIYYTQQSPKREVLSEIRLSKSDADKADLASERILLEIPHPYWNHNGGTRRFGPRGILYLSVGDGG